MKTAPIAFQFFKILYDQDFLVSQARNMFTMNIQEFFSLRQELRLNNSHWVYEEFFFNAKKTSEDRTATMNELIEENEIKKAKAIL